MTETCLTCRHRRVRFFSSPGARDGVAGTYSDRCMRLARDPDDPEAIGWSTVYETMEPPPSVRCGKGRQFWQAKAGA